MFTERLRGRCYPKYLLIRSIEAHNFVDRGFVLRNRRGRVENDDLPVLEKRLRIFSGIALA